jgi:hypothetical protein
MASSSSIDPRSRAIRSLYMSYRQRGQSLADYISDLSVMLHRVRRAGFQISELVAAEHLRDTVRPTLRDLSHSVFDDLVVIDSEYGIVISYSRYERQLERAWRHRQDLQTQARRLWAWAFRRDVRYGPGTHRAAVLRADAHQLWESAGLSVSEDEEPMEWFDAETHSEESALDEPGRIGGMPPSDLYHTDESRASVPDPSMDWPSSAGASG